MKLDTTLFNAVLTQVRETGPDDDCKIEVIEGEGALSSANKVFVEYLQLHLELILLNPTAAVATNFQLGLECGLQYAKVSGSEATR